MNAPNPSMPAADTLTITFKGISAVFPVLQATAGAPAADIGKVRAQLGLNLYGSGFNGVAGTVSNKTFIDGDKGELRHCGIPIEQLADKSSFLETTLLLRDEKLPSASTLEDFQNEIAQNGGVDTPLLYNIIADGKGRPPMAMLQSAVAQIDVPDEQAHLMIAKMSTLVANIIRARSGKREPMQSDPSWSYAENFLYMCFADDEGNYTPNPVVTKAMDKILLLHADHEQNASTTTMRAVRSTKATMVASLSAAVGALSGPRHGGANTAVLKMLKEHIHTVDDIPAYLARAERKEVELMGFGHRVYKNMDPRAGVLKGDVDALLEELHVSDPRLVVAKELERQALTTDYFKARKLFPNVDFYSGIALSAMGFHEDDFTLLFALGRTPGWIVQAQELDKNKEPIARPMQVYQGHAFQDYVPMAQRMGANGGPAMEEGPKEPNV